jgi:HEPN domain-containing protein
MGDDCPFGLICFHAQQVAEKYIKAVLTYHQIQFRKSHDLKELARLLPKGISLGIGGRSLAGLSEHGVRPRYPYIGEPETRTSALRSLRQAERIKQSALRCLPDLS